MRYRPLGSSGVLISELSFGCGRLPEDDEESTRVIHAAIDAGCNYFETATFYCNSLCQQKTALGVKGFTDRIIVSPKIGIELDATAASYRKELDRQMTVLGIDHAKWLMVGWMAQDRMEILTKKGGPLEAIHQAMNEGIVDHIGFTGHDTPANFIDILKTRIFESMTISYNLLSRAYEPAIAAAHELGIGVIVMNPVGGGMLGAPSPAMQQLIPGGSVTSSAATALRFVLSHPGVSTACSGMCSVEMVAENAAVIEERVEERAQVRAILDQFQALGEQFCTGCRYCMPCPHGVDIPANFRLYNMAKIYRYDDAARDQFAGMKEAERAGACTRCGECEKKCPNHLPVMAQLEEVLATLAPVTAT